MHGMSRVDGEKMSKRAVRSSRPGLRKRHRPEYLRYYYAAKLGPTSEDLDLDLDDFVSKVNSDLVNKLVNIASRSAGFIHKHGGGRLATALPAPDLYAEFAAAADDLAEDFEQREYARAVRKIMALADRANQYIDERKPWILAKKPDADVEIVAVCTQGLNLFRALIVYLKPIVPALAARAEALLAAGELRWQDAATPLLGVRIAKFEALLTRVETATVESPHETRTQRGYHRSDIPERRAAARSISRVPEDRPARRARHRGILVDGADKLLRLRLDVGDAERTVFAGIRSCYEPAALRIGSWSSSRI